MTLAVGLILLQFVEVSWRYLTIGALTGLTSVLTLWSLREALGGIRWLTTIILPSLFTAGVGLFYFLLPQTWLSSLPVAVVFAFGMYALLLTENIFSVAALRTIQLFRAASAVGFLLTLTTAFLLYDTAFSFRLSYLWNSALVYIISFPLFFQALWSVGLGEKVSLKLLLYTFLLSLVLAEAALVISFYPVSIAMGSLFLTAVVYVLLGLTQAYFAERLFRQTAYEYLSVGALVLMILILTTRWGGQ